MPIKIGSRKAIEETLAALRDVDHSPRARELSHYFISVATSAGLSEYIKLYQLASLSGAILRFIRNNRGVIAPKQRQLPLAQPKSNRQLTRAR